MPILSPERLYTYRDHLDAAIRQLNRAHSFALAGRPGDALEEMIASRASTTRAIAMLPRPPDDKEAA